MRYPYRVGGSRGRDLTQTNYGNVRPREGLANNRREYITHLRLTRQRLPGGGTKSGGSGGGSGVSESNSSTAPPTSGPTFALTIANNTTESFTFGRKDIYGLVICHFLMYRGDPANPPTLFAHGKFGLSHDGTFAFVDDPEFSGFQPVPPALPNAGLDSNGNPHFMLSAEIDSNLDLVLFVTSSNDATIDGGTIRLGVVYSLTYPEIQT